MHTLVKKSSPGVERLRNEKERGATDLEDFFAPFRREVIGYDQTFDTPYGKKKLLYADWTASGRLYAPIERQITDVFGPFVANTHTESNITGTVMTQAYEEARRIIKKHVHADEHDVLMISGTGMTSVVCKLQRILGLRVPEQHKKAIRLEEKDRPVIFVTHMEHHSNHISWMETIGDVVLLEPDGEGRVSPDVLKKELEHYRNRRCKIGAFTACSNVTGIVPPYRAMARVMHEHGGVCFIDFASIAPYAGIDMHPADPLEKLDGIYFSPHKFLGGPGTCGVLVFDSRLCRNNIPDQPGGGTVIWTNPWGTYKYVKELEVREDGGTPGFLQTIRTALCIRLKEQMGTERMLARERQMLHRLWALLDQVPGIRILDGHRRNRMGIVSFEIEGLHHQLIVKLLSDRYGIQTRGGCSCAGTYGHYLLGIDQAASEHLLEQLEKGDLLVKPGWVRLSIHPVMTDAEIDMIGAALKEIAEHKEELKRDYVYDPVKNRFVHYRENGRVPIAAWFELGHEGNLEAQKEQKQTFVLERPKHDLTVRIGQPSPIC